MAPKRTCDKELAYVEVDIREGEYLLYELSFKGALPKFVITDEEERIILDDSHSSTNGKFSTEWPPIGGWMWDGEDMHTFAGLFALATEYRIKISLKNAGGATLKVIRNCRFSSTKPSDVAFELLPVFVVEEN